MATIFYIKKIISHELRVNNHYFIVLLCVATRACEKALCHTTRVVFSDWRIGKYLVVSTVERCCKTTNTMGCRFTTVTYTTALIGML